MNLIDASVQFPTVIFTIGLLVALVYWLFVILGALDIDLLGGADDVSGALKGAGEAVTGGVKGAAEAVTGGVKGGAEAAHAHDVGGGLWAWLGLATVPVTVSMSVVLLLTWAGSILAMQYGPHGLGTALAIVRATCRCPNSARLSANCTAVIALARWAISIASSAPRRSRPKARCRSSRSMRT